jgi:Protein of unknown function (DUF763)
MGRKGVGADACDPRSVGGRKSSPSGTRLGTIITEAIVQHHDRDEFLRRMANPFWFQSFGAAMGMDWHSSGNTTSVIGASLLPTFPGRFI